VPPLATRRMARSRLAAAWCLSAIAYAAGLLLSTILDLPSGPAVVWALVAFGLTLYATISKTRAAASGA